MNDNDNDNELEKQNTDIKSITDNDTLVFQFENEKLLKSCLELESTDQGKIEYDGKKYLKVSKRLEVIRRHLGFNLSIQTKIEHMSDAFVLVKAIISIYKNNNWHIVATGYAEEKRNSSEINRTSAIENAETSAIGRSLACLGLLSDSEYASIDEIVFTLNNKDSNDKESNNKDKKSSSNNKISNAQIDYINKLIKNTGTILKGFLDHYKITEIQEMNEIQLNDAIQKLKIKEKNLNKNKNDLNDEKEKTLSILNENSEKERSYKKENNKEDHPSVEVNSEKENISKEELEKDQTIDEKDIVMDDKTEVVDDTVIVDKTEVVDDTIMVDETEVVNENNDTVIDDKTKVVDENNDIVMDDKTKVVKHKNTAGDVKKETAKKPSRTKKQTKELEKRTEVGNNLDDDEDIIL